MKKFEKIQHFSHFLAYMRKYRSWVKSVTLEGSVKLHGTNAGLNLTPDGKLWAQSRRRRLTVDSDNFGFASWADTNKDALRSCLEGIAKENKVADLTIYGEWIGSGIQQKVAVSKMPRHFVPFAMHSEHGWHYIRGFEMEKLATARIPAIQSRRSCVEYITVALDGTESAIRMLHGLTEAVDKECPYARCFGMVGCGEGWVWIPTHIDGKKLDRPDYDLAFKTKGDSHTQTKQKSGVKEDKYGDPELIAYVGSLSTHERFIQGVQHLRDTGKELAPKSIPDYILWLNADLEAEEGLIIEQKGLDAKAVRKMFTRDAISWFKSYLESPEAEA